MQMPFNILINMKEVRWLFYIIDITLIEYRAKIIQEMDVVLAGCPYSINYARGRQGSSASIKKAVLYNFFWSCT